MQFSVIRTYAASRFRDAGNVIVTDADWKLYVNTAYGDVLMRIPYAPWNEASSSLTVTNGSRSVSLPTDVNRVTSVWNSTDQYPMVPLEGRNQVYNEYPAQNESGGPMHYRIQQNKLQVYPLPAQDTVFVVEYLVMPAALSADADLPAFPSQYHDILVSGAVALAYRDDGNIPMAQQYEAETRDMAQALFNDAMQPKQDRYYEIVDTNW